MRHDAQRGWAGPAESSQAGRGALLQRRRRRGVCRPGRASVGGRAGGGATATEGHVCRPGARAVRRYMWRRRRRARRPVYGDTRTPLLAFSSSAATCAPWHRVPENLVPASRRVPRQATPTAPGYVPAGGHVGGCATHTRGTVRGPPTELKPLHPPMPPCARPAEAPGWLLRLAAREDADCRPPPPHAALRMTWLLRGSRASPAPPRRVASGPRPRVRTRLPAALRAFCELQRERARHVPCCSGRVPRAGTWPCRERSSLCPQGRHEKIRQPR